jgi:hypothetical protein
MPHGVGQRLLADQEICRSTAGEHDCGAPFTETSSETDDRHGAGAHLAQGVEHRRSSAGL